MESKTFLEIKHITKTYGELIALNDVSLEVVEGEILSLLGINGAGKTTLSSIIATLHPQTSGELLFRGTVVSDNLLDYRRMVGYCQQIPNLQNSMTVRENLYAAGTYFAMTKAEIAARIVTITEKLQLAAVLDRYPQHLSGGYKQRCMIARSLLHNPALLILDEPTVGLDPHIRRALWDVIKSLKQDGVTVILTTHYLDEAEYLSDRVCLLDHGKMRRLDTLANLQKHYNKQKLEDIFLQFLQDEI